MCKISLSCNLWLIGRTLWGSCFGCTVAPYSLLIIGFLNLHSTLLTPGRMQRCLFKHSFNDLWTVSLSTRVRTHAASYLRRERSSNNTIPGFVFHTCLQSRGNSIKLHSTLRFRLKLSSFCLNFTVRNHLRGINRSTQLTGFRFPISLKLFELIETLINHCIWCTQLLHSN